MPGKFVLEGGRRSRTLGHKGAISCSARISTELSQKKYVMRTKARRTSNPEEVPVGSAPIAVQVCKYENVLSFIVEGNHFLVDSSHLLHPIMMVVD